MWRKLMIGGIGRHTQVRYDPKKERRAKVGQG
jgi:hypothetical protein